ncbi:MAG: sugar transferase [bacterium]
MEQQHVVLLQRRRFWRELAFAAAVLSADALTIAFVFVILAQAAIGIGTFRLEFANGLVPLNPPALVMRIALLLFCLSVARAYSTTSSATQSGRIALAMAIGILVPQWSAATSAMLAGRMSLVAFVVVLLWLALVGQRSVTRRALQAFDPRRLDQERTLLVGVGRQLRTFLDEHVDVTAPPPSTYEIDPEWPGEQREGWQSLYAEVHRSMADAIILVGPLGDAALQSVLIAGSSAGCRVFGLRRRPLREMNNPTLMRRGEGPIALLSSPALIGWQLVTKRAFDVAGAALGLILLSPLLAICAVLVKLTSRGPVLFVQQRVGLGGESFRMLKFRTRAGDGTTRRVTPVGRLLRRTSLNELPQLWNVLRGEMSLVGPRPPIPRELARYQMRHFVRFEVTPGITGPWQVSGGHDITNFDAVVRIEQEYVNGWTLWRDVALLLRSIPVVMRMSAR